MRVYNSSHTQQYAHHEILIKPGFTDIPQHLEESVKGLIKKYGAHLSEGGAPAAEGAKKDQTIIHQATQIAELKAQVAKLQLLVTNSADDESQKAALIARAEQAEVENKELKNSCQAAVNRIEELSVMLSEAREQVKTEPAAPQPTAIAQKKK